jgi:Rrf2 family protein
VDTRRHGGWQDHPVHIHAKTDYAVRAAVQLASSSEFPVTSESIAQAQDIPAKFLEAILSELRHAGLVKSRRGAHGGYWLSRPASEISVADVIRAVEGPMALVRGERPEFVTYPGAAEPLRDVWVAVRAALRGVLSHVTLADIATGHLPKHIKKLTAPEEAWIAPWFD